ncbi:hypothetical protein ACFQNF_19410 [Iodobacter arcticus]|uniref:SMI1/KNR4 family protein n=1 Tax=Iodobacter arcticus TaxID=590593 RepID=A0ABW2R402_9NEIS
MLKNNIPNKIKRPTNINLPKLIGSIKSIIDTSYIEYLEWYHEYLRDDGLLIYCAEDLEERNETFEIATYCPGYILIGDNSGGRGFLMSTQGTGEIFSSDFGDLSPDYFLIVSSDFTSWMNSNFKN